MDQDVTRPDLSGEVRFRVPLVFAIPLVALVVIGGLAFGFSQVLLNLESKEGATTIAIVMAANVLAACAFLAVRQRVHRSSVIEVVLIALWPVVVGIALATTGLLAEEEAHPEPGGEPKPPVASDSELVAEGTAWTTDTLTLPASGGPIPIENKDATVHNMSIYPDEAAAQAKQDPLFTGEDVAGGESTTYEVDGQKPGTYTFICDYHTNMIGEITFQ
jgi:plastocyanin